ncbi:MAG TPA: T9SS type A sorting domain-containing protein [Saprospiraceae bacterium]|nr:T9SS type A sorting domain-containing protein [Saprospiraceae bacterium]
MPLTSQLLLNFRKFDPFAIMILVFIFAGFEVAWAQTPDWAAAYSARGPFDDISEGICTDGNGNVYTTGYFRESMDFGQVSLSGNGGGDIFLAKYNRQGQLEWAQSFGGTALDFSVALVADSNGDIIFTGGFRSSSITFGNWTLTNPNINAGNNTFFVCKIDSGGNVLWAKTAIGDGNCRGFDIDTDNNGNVIVLGNYNGVGVSFGTQTVNNTSQFSDDLFVVKYNAAGDELWARSFGGNSTDSGFGLSTDNSGKIHLTGCFNSSSITFDGITLDNTGAYDIFITQLNENGQTQWARRPTGNSDDIGTAITTDEMGNIYAAGYYASRAIDFGLSGLSGNGFNTIYIAKYNNIGDLLWLRPGMGNNNDEVLAIDTDSDGAVVFTGQFTSETLNFGNLTVSNSRLNYSDIFVTALDANGQYMWALSAEGNEDDYGAGIAGNSNGSIYITGGFWSPEIFFGSNALSNASMRQDYYLAEINTSTGIPEFDPGIHFSMYPNPAQERIQINADKAGLLTVTDPAGQILISTELIPGSRQIGISTLIPGVYMVQFRAGEQIWTRKLVKM